MCAISYSMDYLYRHLYRLKRSLYSFINPYFKINAQILQKWLKLQPLSTAQKPSYPLICDFRLGMNFIAFFKLKNVVQFSHSVLSNSLQSHGLRHARLPCPSPTPGACSNSCPLSWWWHPTISSSVIPLSSSLHSFPVSGSFQWVSSSYQVAQVLELQLQHQSFQWIFRVDFL